MSTNLTCKAISGRATTLALGLIGDQDSIQVYLVEHPTAPTEMMIVWPSGPTMISPERLCEATSALESIGYDVREAVMGHSPDTSESVRELVAAALA